MKLPEEHWLRKLQKKWAEDSAGRTAEELRVIVARDLGRAPDDVLVFPSPHGERPTIGTATQKGK